MKKLIFLLPITLWSQTTVNERIVFVSQGPQPVNPYSIRVRVNGPLGKRFLYYWVVANYNRGPVLPRSPVVVMGAPDAYGPSNNVTISWNPVPNAISYTILRTSTSRITINQSCNCLIATTTNTTFVDDVDTPSSYTPISVGPTQGSITLDNKNFENPTWVFEPSFGAGGAVSSVFGRVGNVVAQTGDYAASQVTVYPTGNITVTDVQNALAQLDTIKAQTSHNHSASDITSGVLPVARGGTGISTLTGGRCIQSKSDGSGFEETPGACGTGGSNTPIGYSASFESGTTWVLTGSTHGLGTCNLVYSVVTESGGVQTVTEGFSSISCNTSTFDIAVQWPTATAGRLTIVSSASTGGGGGGSFDPSGTYDLTGLNKVNVEYTSIYLQNHSTSGTALYRTVCVASDGRASQCTTVNAPRTIGVCLQGCGTTGNARIAVSGKMTCEFEGGVTAGNWATVSSSQSGKCVDAGTTKPAVPLGIILVTQSGAGNYDIIRGIQ